MNFDIENLHGPAEAHLEKAWGAGEGVPSLFFVITLKNYKLLFTVELIINNVPLTHVSPNNIETCLTPNYCCLANIYFIILTQHQSNRSLKYRSLKQSFWG